MKNSLESIATRGISIFSKFLLIGFLVKKLSLSDYGDFQLISYFILFSTTIFGLEYYNISNRQIVNSQEKQKTYNFHLSFFFYTFGAGFIIQLVSFFTVLPSQLLSVFNFSVIFIISLCDYISQEIYRYLMINKEFRKANLQLIYKSFFFLIFIVVYTFLSQQLSFRSVLLLMFGSYVLLLILALFTFSKTLFSIEKIKVKKLSIKKLKSTLLKLLPFITLVLFVKGIEFSDKFIIGKILGSDEVGIYSFLYTLGSVLNIFIVSGFYLIYLPELIKKYKKDRTNFKKLLLKFGKLNISFSVLLLIGIKLTETVVFNLIGKTVFLDYTNMLTVILIGFVVYNLSLIPHIYLYVSNNEKSIMYITGIALLVNLLLTFYFINAFGVIGVAYSLLCTYMFMLISKSFIGYKKWKKLI